MLEGLQNQIAVDGFSIFCRNFREKLNELAQHLGGSKVRKIVLHLSTRFLPDYCFSQLESAPMLGDLSL
jgi:hypothetical protein